MLVMRKMNKRMNKWVREQAFTIGRNLMKYKKRKEGK